MRLFLSTFNNLAKTVRHCVSDFGIDQGILNYLYYNELWTPLRVHVWPQGVGPVNTIAIADLQTNPDGFVLNNNGNISGLVHQWDRHVSLSAKYMALVGSLTNRRDRETDRKYQLGRAFV